MLYNSGFITFFTADKREIVMRFFMRAICAQNSFERPLGRIQIAILEFRYADTVEKIRCIAAFDVAVWNNFAARDCMAYRRDISVKRFGRKMRSRCGVCQRCWRQSDCR